MHGRMKNIPKSTEKNMIVIDIFSLPLPKLEMDEGKKIEFHFIRINTHLDLGRPPL
jgi:hypothetical protein